MKLPKIIKNRLELYLLPLIIIVFLVAYHYYRFYEKDFKKIFNHIPFTLNKNQYEEIQEFHPYYQVYKLSKEVKKPEATIIYVRTKTNPKDKQYLHELNIMIDYFFYPKIIKPYSFKEFSKIKLNKNNIIITDNDLSLTYKNYSKLEPIFFIKKDLIRINRRKEDDYFIYKVL